MPIFLNCAKKFHTKFIYLSKLLIALLEVFCGSHYFSVAHCLKLLIGRKTESCGIQNEKKYIYIKLIVPLFNFIYSKFMFAKCQIINFWPRPSFPYFSNTFSKCIFLEQPELLFVNFSAIFFDTTLAWLVD